MNVMGHRLPVALASPSAGYIANRAGQLLRLARYAPVVSPDADLVGHIGMRIVFATTIRERNVLDVRALAVLDAGLLSAG